MRAYYQNESADGYTPTRADLDKIVGEPTTMSAALPVIGETEMAHY